MQFGFQQDRSATDAIFVMRQLQERYEEKKKVYYVFVDLEMTCDSSKRSDSIGFQKADGSWEIDQIGGGIIWKFSE